MLQIFYDEFGFFGSILMSLVLFLAFIFWFSGLAGIANLDDNVRKKNIKMIAAVVFPPFPIGWLIIDIYRQHKVIKQSKQ